jgi:Aminotransferase class-III/Amino acid kinase family
LKIIVQKYGGSSVATVEKLKDVARRVVAAKQKRNAVVVVVSAMGDSTDDLVGLARQLSDNPSRRELDALLATGEMVSMALLAIAIQECGENAVALNGLQCGIFTNDVHCNARILEVRPARIRHHFSFEQAGIQPDLVCLSKSISGYGLPMSLVMIHPEIDIWHPGEHTGTFRGNNLAFITAAEALSYWQDNSFSNAITEKSGHAAALLQQIAQQHAAHVRGRGLIQAVVFAETGFAERISQAAFARGVIIATCGPRDEALKLLPSLTINHEELEQGISILEESAEAVQEGMTAHAIAG